MSDTDIILHTYEKFRSGNKVNEDYDMVMIRITLPIKTWNEMKRGYDVKEQANEQ